MDKDFNKIVIVSLDTNLSRSVGEALSQGLGMMFCDCKDLMEYELMDKDSIKKFCTKEFLDAAEKRVFKKIASFVNVVVSIDFDAFVHNFKTLEKGSISVFLNIPKNKVPDAVSVLAFDSRKIELEKLCTVTLNLKKLDEKFVCDKIVKALGGIV